MKIALGQMEVRAGNIEVNLKVMKSMIEDAVSQQADLIVFPEQCVGGYLLGDTWLDESFCDQLEQANELILSWSKSIAIIYGNISTLPYNGVSHGRDGRRIRLNCAYFAYQQQWVTKEDSVEHRYVKHLNPDYRIFDDSRYFLSALELSAQKGLNSVAELKSYVLKKDNQVYRIGLEVCEDLWSKDYSFDVTEGYIQQGVEMIVNISSSPWTRNKESARDRLIENKYNKAQDNFPYFVYVNCVGMQNTGKNVVVFDGDSSLYNKQGKLINRCNEEFKEECKVVDLKEEDCLPVAKNKVVSALLCAIKAFDDQLFHQQPPWIIGLSGGIDSAINAALLCLAIGSDRVVGYGLSSRYNSDKTKNNAKTIADKLNIRFISGSIEEVDEATLTTIKSYGYQDTYASLVYENIQARLRGHLLSTFASIEGGVIVNNGNKVELALGYCTLYGDAIGALSPLGDCTKVQLFELAEMINDIYKDEIIPRNLIPSIDNEVISWEMPPSAELKEAQFDPMKWFYHDWLIEKLLEYPCVSIEKIMESYLDGTLLNGEMGKWLRYYKLDDASSFIKDLQWIRNTLKSNVFKRMQTPPVVMISRGAFGSDYREVQLPVTDSEQYLSLKEKILNRK